MATKKRPARAVRKLARARARSQDKLVRARARARDKNLIRRSVETYEKAIEVMNDTDKSVSNVNEYFSKVGAVPDSLPKKHQREIVRLAIDAEKALARLRNYLEDVSTLAMEVAADMLEDELNHLESLLPRKNS